MRMPNQESDKEPTGDPLPGSITSLETQKKNPRRISVFIDHAFAFGVHQDVLLQHDLHPGRYLNADLIRSLADADALLRAKEMAMKYLGHRARSIHEVRQKLDQGGFREETVTRVVERLQELGYLDDRYFASQFVRDRFNTKGYGPLRLRADLQRLGIDASLIDETLRDHLEDGHVLESALEQGRKRWKRLSGETDRRKQQKKLFDFLLRRGHTIDIAQQVLRLLEKEDEENTS